MRTNITLDRLGRVVIPKPLREKLRLGPGDGFSVEESGGNLTLSPVRVSTPLRKEHGVWVRRTGERLPASTAQDAIDSSRTERDDHLLGKTR